MQALLEEGQRFERYRVLRRLSYSISGTSYEAEDTMLQRRVTLKLLLSQKPFSDSARRQFFREMQEISSLTHPCLAAILDYGEAEGQLFIARRYVEPGSLLGNEGRYWFSPPLATTDAISYIRQLAQVLHYIHTHGYFHGCLTFSNILVLHSPKADEKSEIAPFMLADIGTTHFVRRFGQPHIKPFPITAAPEQLSQQATAASDQYALAVLLYFWLAGCPPFLGSPEEIEQLKLTETITRLRTLNQQVTVEQEEIIQRALHAHPDERYSSILAFAEALQTSLIHPSATEKTTQLAPLTDKPTDVSITVNESALQVETTRQAEIPSAAQARLQPITHADIAHELVFLGEAETKLLLHENGYNPVTIDKAISNGSSHVKQDFKVGDHHTAEPAQHALSEPSSESIASSTPEQKLQPTADTAQITSESSSSGEHTEREYPSKTPLPTLAYLIVTSPETEEQYEALLTQETTTLGRAGSSDILLTQDPQTSRHHALLKREGGNYVLYDQRSASGISVNGQQLISEVGYILSHGDQISIGKYKFLFCVKQVSDGDNSQL